MDDVIANQYYLFNHDQSEDASSFIAHLVNEKLMVYAKMDKIDTHEPSNTHYHHRLQDIEWRYDNNNLRTPYYEDQPLNTIQLGEQDNVYDYISSASVIACNDEIICGENFLKLADCFIGSIYSLNANPNTHRFSKQNIHIDCINDTDELFIACKRIFVKTDDIQHFYNRFHNNLEDKVIITHNSDHEISREGFSEHIKKVKKQYSQNCLFADDTAKLVPIPIGIENRMWFDHEILHNVRRRIDIHKSKNIYFYFSLHTHASRHDCYNTLKEKLEFNQSRSREDYFVELKRHKYAICPRGNGLDTHRLWECFYLDVIPIMLKSDCVNIDNLPIIYLDKWSDLDVNNLASDATVVSFKDQALRKITISAIDITK